MRIVEEDIVHWEPLQMRFVMAGDVRADRLAELALHLESWFSGNAQTGRSDCDIRFWNVTVSQPDAVEANCEHLTRKSLRRLTNSTEKAFPELDHVRIGFPIDGIPSGLEFRWERLPGSEVTLHGNCYKIDPVAISMHQVSIGQFVEFMRDAGYRPDADQRNGDGYLEDHLRLNFGKSPKLPACDVSFRDACGFCEWAGLRLPSEPELYLFFVTTARNGKEFDWGGECWTSTPSKEGGYVLVNGPYKATLDLPLEQFRREYSPDHYDYPFPCFRVAKGLPNVQRTAMNE
jgi:hypothetical protein